MPPEVTITTERDDSVLLVTVTDNGAGIPAGTVTRMLDFTTLTSDKALYRSPARGAQGNALKTIIGIPRALGMTGPVIITARGVRHEITVSIDAAGNVQVRHDTSAGPLTAGTSVTVPLPADLDLDASQWARGYALANPHAAFTVNEHAHGDDPEDPNSYKPTAGDTWRKPVPGDPTQPLVVRPCSVRQAGREPGGGRRRPSRRRVHRRVPGPVSDRQAQAGRRCGPRHPPRHRTRRQPGRLPGTARRDAPGRPGPPGARGPRAGPEAHYRAILVGDGDGRFWYRHGGLVHDGIAWHIEVAIAEDGARYHGEHPEAYACNYAASFDDPLGGVRLRTADVSGYGATGFLEQCDALPRRANDRGRAAAVHVTCAAPVFTDKGKTRLNVPPEVADAFAKVLWQAGKDLYREKRQADRAVLADRRRGEEASRRERGQEPTLREAVLAVMARAVAQQQGGTSLPYSARSLFYKIRPLVQQVTSRTLTDTYFTQNLLPAYQREHGQLPGLYYEPRGELHEPHDPHGDTTLPLGTREVTSYVPPAWTFDKVLVVEKAGLWQVLRDSRIGDRYDMAVITSSGFAVEACRSLLASLAAGEDVTIFALHDADPAGYNIARTLGEETARMPGHSVSVIDLGLTVDDAARLGLEGEAFTRTAALPGGITDRLSDEARRWFEGTPCEWDHYGRPSKWQCRRTEAQRVHQPRPDHLHRGRPRPRHGATAKVIPPADVLAAEARRHHDLAVTGQVHQIIAELVDADAIASQVCAETAARLQLHRRPGGRQGVP